MFNSIYKDAQPFERPKYGSINLSYEKVISEANILNYDYIGDSFSLSFSRSFKLN